MPGLNLGTYGGVRVSQTPTTAPQASSVTQAAFGPGYSSPQASTGSVLFPNDPFGVAFWMGVLGIAGLVFIRHSLPR